MIKTIGFCEFTDSFRNMGRGEQFSYHGLEALYDYLEELGEDIGEEIELDVIALCCEYTEYEDFEEFQGDYGDNYETLEDVENETTVIRIDSSAFIIQQF
jgi:hypothetical protein